MSEIERKRVSENDRLSEREEARERRKRVNELSRERD